MNSSNLTPIAIFGAPRSGTSWLGQLFNSSPHVGFRFQPLFSYAFKGRLNEYSSSEDIESFYKDLSATNDAFVLQKQNITGKEEYNFHKENLTHLVWKEVRYLHIVENLMKNSSTKVVGIVRHPCGVISSWLKAPKEFKAEWNIADEWRSAPSKNKGLPEEFNGFEKWKQVAYMFRDFVAQYPSQFLLIRYEDLNDNPVQIMKQAFEFCDLPFTMKTEEFIHQTRSQDSADSYGVFRKHQSAENWRNDLPGSVREEILTDSEFRELNEFYQWK